MEKILTGKDCEFVMGEFGSFDEYNRKWLKRRMARRGIINPQTADISVKAIVNNGRWVVPCPFCSGAEAVWEDNPVFMCQSCFNKKAGGKFVKVEFPVARKSIEKALVARPDKRTRNWFPGETVKKLLDENKTHSGVS